MQIQKLESDLGVQLLERGKALDLTEAGRYFYEHSLNLLKDMERLQGSITEYQTGSAGKIRLGATDPTASYRLPRLLQQFMAAYPKVEISVDIAGTTALTVRLLRGELDIILCSAPELGKELHYEPLFTEEFVLLMPEGHPLAAEPLLTADHLRGHRLLITASGCPYRKKLESVLQETAGPPLNTMEIGSMSALKFYVEQGLGIALVPEVTLHPDPEGTVRRALEGRAVNMTCGIACRLSDYPLKTASLNLYGYLQDKLAEQPVL
jgi:DNA-binding transcriptional LysR family regulator